MEYVPFTEEQKQRANSVDLVDFLQCQGEELIRSGHEWRWKRHDSVTIRGSEWFRHKSKEGGHAIDFVLHFYNKSFPEAVQWLLGGESAVEWNQFSKSAPPLKKEFVLPEANPDMRRVFAYLIKQRFISQSVLSYFARERLIYEDKEYHNAVFVGLDESGIPRHAHKRGTYTQGKPYKGNVEGSDPNCSFHYLGTDDTLYVFEAPVDMLSFITLHPEDWQRHSYVALDGVAEHAMLHLLKCQPNLKNVVLCLDHDAAGIEAACRLKDILADHDYSIDVRQSRNKDWNEDLKAMNGVTPIPASEHPMLALLPEIRDQLLDDYQTMVDDQNLDTNIHKQLDRLKPFLVSEKLAAANRALVDAGLRKIAALSLLAAQRELRQMERPVSPEEFTAEVLDSYRPHRDRGWMRTKVEGIRAAAADIDCRLRQSGIRTLEDRMGLVDAYKRFALECVKARLFVRVDAPQPLQAPEETIQNFKMSL